MCSVAAGKIGRVNASRVDDFLTDPGRLSSFCDPVDKIRECCSKLVSTGMVGDFHLL